MLSPDDLTAVELAAELDEMGVDLAASFRHYDSDLVHAAAAEIDVAHRQISQLQRIVWLLVAMVLGVLLWWGVEARDGRDCIDPVTELLEVCP